MLQRLVVSLLLTGLPYGIVSAAPITMHFTASGFSAIAPVDPISGTVKWEATSPNAPIDTFTSIDLTIAGHAYSLGDVGFLIDPGNPNRFFIGVPGINTVTGNTNDFVLAWFGDSLTGDLFAYAVEGTLSAFITRSVSSFQVTADATGAPEPASGALLALALGSLAMMRRRRAS